MKNTNLTAEYEVKLRELENEINSDIENRIKNGEKLSKSDKINLALEYLGYTHRVSENYWPKYPVDKDGYIPFSVFEEIK